MEDQAKEYIYDDDFIPVQWGYLYFVGGKKRFHRFKSEKAFKDAHDRVWKRFVEVGETERWGGFIIYVKDKDGMSYRMRGNVLTHVSNALPYSGNETEICKLTKLPDGEGWELDTIKESDK